MKSLTKNTRNCIERTYWYCKQCINYKKQQICISGSSDKTIRVWNLIKPKIVFEGHTDYVKCLAITSDNNYIISGSEDKSIRIWNLVERQQESCFEGHTTFVTALVVIKDNKYVASGSKDKTIRLWNLLKKRAKEIVLQEHTSAIHSIVVTAIRNILFLDLAVLLISFW